MGGGVKDIILGRKPTVRNIESIRMSRGEQKGRNQGREQGDN